MTEFLQGPLRQTKCQHEAEKEIRWGHNAERSKTDWGVVGEVGVECLRWGQNAERSKTVWGVVGEVGCFWEVEAE